MDENIVQNDTGKKKGSFWCGVLKFLIGFLLGLGGWLAHVVIHTVFAYIMDGDLYFGLWGTMGLFGMFFFLCGWEVIAIIAGIISIKKGTKKAFGFVAIMVALLSFVVGGCAGLMSR